MFAGRAQVFLPKTSVGIVVVERLFVDGLGAPAVCMLSAGARSGRRRRYDVLRVDDGRVLDC